jgi:hypothetical protein
VSTTIPAVGTAVQCQLLQAEGRKLPIPLCLPLLTPGLGLGLAQGSVQQKASRAEARMSVSRFRHNLGHHPHWPVPFSCPVPCLPLLPQQCTEQGPPLQRPNLVHAQPWAGP